MKNNQGVLFKPNPFEEWKDWSELARKYETNDPEAMSLATVSAEGQPPEGIRFFTNSESDKGVEIAANPHVALCFHWKSLRRQVRVQGSIARLPPEEDDAYFHQRHRESQLGAWASQQSRPLDNMIHLNTMVHQMHNKYEGHAVPRPPYWGGYEVTPLVIEFWAEQPHRLHERMRYTYVDDAWKQQRLFP